jgi:succinate-semialdehyde dehydrogenase/glutarate-semialdehyde dehydrogenase
MSLQLNDNELLLTQGWIDGAGVASAQQFAVTNPASRENIALLSDLDANHARDAIAAAVKAFSLWKKVPASERILLVRRWADLIEQNAADLGTIICSESGKPVAQARGEATQCVALLRWFAERAACMPQAGLPAQTTQQHNFIIKQPVGVVACITPWNFPAAAVIVKSGAAIVSGCAVIVKPSDETPLIALAFARLADRAGIPAGVFNVLPCKNPAPIGAELCQSPDVRMLSFTGSTHVGKQLYAACGDTVKRIALELGGNAPFVVFADADLDLALDGAMGARFYNSGQICVGANRYLVQDSIYDEFAARLATRVKAMRVGDGFDASSDIGPMINQAAIDRLAAIIKSSQALGAKLLSGGGQDDASTLYFQPTVLTDMTPEMPAWSTEIFGPVACLYRFSDEADVLQLANATPAGLSAYVYSRDAARLQRFADDLEAGVVGVNSANIFANDLPFGGIKQSGLGREHGMDCLDEYVETKSICVGPA